MNQTATEQAIPASATLKDWSRNMAPSPLKNAIDAASDHIDKVERQSNIQSQAISKLVAQYNRDMSLMQERLKNQIVATSDAVRETQVAKADAETLKASYEKACVLVADMHAAAVGYIGGPITGVVEDVAKLRKERDQFQENLGYELQGLDALRRQYGARWEETTPQWMARIFGRRGERQLKADAKLTALASQLAGVCAERDALLNMRPHAWVNPIHNELFTTNPQMVYNMQNESGLLCLPLYSKPSELKAFSEAKAKREAERQAKVTADGSGSCLYGASSLDSADHQAGQREASQDMNSRLESMNTQPAPEVNVFGLGGRFMRDLDAMNSVGIRLTDSNFPAGCPVLE